MAQVLILDHVRPVQRPPGALVGQRGVHVAVGDHHRAPVESRPDDLLHVLGPVGRVQQRLGPRRQPLVHRVQQDRAQPHAHLGRAGLPGLHDVEALVAQPDREQPGLGGLPRPLAALERDEHPARLLGLLGREPLPAHRRDQVGDDRDALAVVHLQQRDDPDDHREQPADHQHQVGAVELVDRLPADHDLAPAEQARERRRDRDHQQQGDPGERLQEGERTAPQAVVHLQPDHACSR